MSTLDCQTNFLEMLIQNEVLTLFSTDRNQVNRDDKSPFHLAQLKQLTTISQTCVNGMDFLVLLFSCHFGHAEWNEA